MKKIYIVYDERAHFQDVDDCVVLLTTDSKKEAEQEAKESNGVVVAYEEKDGELISTN